MKRGGASHHTNPGMTHAVGKGNDPVISADKPPCHPQSASTTHASNSGNKTGGGLRLGGLSRYLLEKAQSNDSGLDLSPASLQSLAHPLRTSGSSTSSLNGRNLFESPEYSSDQRTTSPFLVIPTAISDPLPAKSDPVPAVTSTEAYRSSLSERSHNSSESTVIEKTLTDALSSTDISMKDMSISADKLSGGNTKAGDGSARNVQFSKQYLTSASTSADNVTPKDRVFHVPPSHQKEKSKYGKENLDPIATHHYSNSHSQTFHPTPHQNVDVAAIIPHNNSDHHIRKTLHTPKPKSNKKSHHPHPPPPSSAKKQTGWKFLSEHVKNKEYLIIKQLGKGGCGEVSLVIEKDTRKLFALKVVQLHGIDESFVQECINEVEMLIDLKGTDLVVEIHTWEFNRLERTMKIVMEHGQCDLNRSILKSNHASVHQLKSVWERLLLIVDKIHSKGIVHADLKPANFIWVGDNLKIIDFGIASRLQTDLTSIAMPNPKGTLNFISPETILPDDSGRSKLSPKSDIWALGCILYLMVYGRTPFEHIPNPAVKMSTIIKGDIVYPQLPPYLQGSDVISVLKLCFQTDYRRRPTASNLLSHPFLCS